MSFNFSRIRSEAVKVYQMLLDVLKAWWRFHDYFLLGWVSPKRGVCERRTSPLGPSGFGARPVSRRTDCSCCSLTWPNCPHQSCLSEIKVFLGMHFVPGKQHSFIRAKDLICGAISWWFAEEFTRLCHLDKGACKRLHHSSAELAKEAATWISIICASKALSLYYHCTENSIFYRAGPCLQPGLPLWKALFLSRDNQSVHAASSHRYAYVPVAHIEKSLCALFI